MRLLSPSGERRGRRPRTPAYLAATAGFIFGGGLATRPGLAMLMLFGRMAAKETAVNFVTEMVRT